MNKKSSAWLAALTLVAGAAAPGVAFAQSTWNLVSGSGCTQNATNAGNFGNSWTCAGTGNAGNSVQASAYSTQSGAATGRVQNIDTGTQYANAWMSAQGTSGFGVANRTEGLNITAPDHAVDNNPTGSYDMIVLNFGSAVILNQVGIGWASGGVADISVLRWTGTGAPTSSASTTTGGTNALLRNGWTLVSSLADVLTDATAPYGGAARNTYATAASSWWMVAAFNTTLNGSLCYTNNTGGTVVENVNGKCDDGDDAFKLNFLRTTVATTPPGGSAPEPGTLALAGLALAGLAVGRRRQQHAA